MKGRPRETNLSWRDQPRGFPYGNGDVLRNKQYLKDRQKLFREGGNGWWWAAPAKESKRSLKRFPPNFYMNGEMVR